MKQWKIILKNNLDYEEKQTYDLFVFTFLGDKSITNKLEINVIDVDEEPNVTFKFILFMKV